MALFQLNCVSLQSFYIALHITIIRIFTYHHEVVPLLVVSQQFCEGWFRLVYLYQLFVYLALLEELHTNQTMLLAYRCVGQLLAVFTFYLVLLNGQPIFPLLFEYFLPLLQQRVQTHFRGIFTRHLNQILDHFALREWQHSSFTAPGAYLGDELRKGVWVIFRVDHRVVPRQFQATFSHIDVGLSARPIQPISQKINVPIQHLFCHQKSVFIFQSLWFCQSSSQSAIGDCFLDDQELVRLGFMQDIIDLDDVLRPCSFELLKVSKQFGICLPVQFQSKLQSVLLVLCIVGHERVSTQGRFSCIVGVGLEEFSYPRHDQQQIIFIRRRITSQSYTVDISICTVRMHSVLCYCFDQFQTTIPLSSQLSNSGVVEVRLHIFGLEEQTVENNPDRKYTQSHYYDDRHRIAEHVGMESIIFDIRLDIFS